MTVIATAHLICYNIVVVCCIFKIFNIYYRNKKVSFIRYYKINIIIVENLSYIQTKIKTTSTKKTPIMSNTKYQVIFNASDADNSISEKN